MNIIYGGASIIIAAGYSDLDFLRIMTASNIKSKDVRLVDLLGIFQTATQIESWKDLKDWKQKKITSLNNDIVLFENIWRIN